MKPKNLSATSPRLTTGLAGPRSIDACQACGAASAISGWQEHDHNDHPEPFSVWLCEPCSKKLIEPHVRLYRRLRPHTPFPGAMPICVDCKYRDGVTCLNPIARMNGGPGVGLKYPAPTNAHLNYGPRGGEWVKIYTGPVTACSGKVSCNS